MAGMSGQGGSGRRQGGSAQAGSEGGVVSPSSELVFALCHELGNLIAAVRIQAHLLDDELGSKELAVASVEIEDLSARATSLLALVRPLLSPAPADAARVEPFALLATLRQSLEDRGGRGVRIELEPPPELPPVIGDSDVLHHLLLALASHAIEGARPRGYVRLALERCDDHVAFVIEDNAPEREPLSDWPHLERRGRPLTCAIADDILRKRRGRIEVSNEDGINRIALHLPIADP